MPPLIMEMTCRDAEKREKNKTEGTDVCTGKTPFWVYYQYLNFCTIILFHGVNPVHDSVLRVLVQVQSTLDYPDLNYPDPRPGHQNNVIHGYIAVH